MWRQLKVLCDCDEIKGYLLLWYTLNEFGLSYCSGRHHEVNGKDWDLVWWLQYPEGKRGRGGFPLMNGSVCLYRESNVRPVNFDRSVSSSLLRKLTAILGHSQFVWRLAS